MPVGEKPAPVPLISPAAVAIAVSSRAQALIAESVFEETSVDFSSKMDEIRPQLLRLIELRQQSYLAEDRLHHAEIFFSNVLGRLLMRAGMEYSYPLRHSARHLDKDFSRNTANSRACRKACGIPPS